MLRGSSVFGPRDMRVGRERRPESWPDDGHSLTSRRRVYWHLCLKEHQMAFALVCLTTVRLVLLHLAYTGI